MTSSETGIILEAYKKQTADTHELQVVDARGESFAYFLRSSDAESNSDQLDFRWVKKGKIKASITLALSGESDAKALPKAPFGGIWVDGSLSSEGIESFLIAVVAELKHRRIETLQIVQPPKPYEPDSDLINYLLFKNGFVQESIVSHQFFIGKKKIEKFVREGQKKFQHKAKERGVICRSGPIQNFGFLKDIRKWNRERGYDVTFEDSRIVTQVSDFPERYFLISILKHEEAIAYALCVKLLPDSFYYFLSAIHPKSTLKNIGDMCVFQLFQLAASQRANFIDLGSSDLATGANHSLMFFKSRFSNDVFNKVTWKLKL